ncbi:MAG: monofunctional biosynthetic peptidoglycan transglycosylase [Pseudomonadota bacterium]
MVLTALAIIVALPFVLMIVYKAPIMHPVSTLMVRNVLLLDGYQRRWVDFDQIAPVLVQSVLMSEDGQFCAHHGVDWNALNLVIDEALDGETPRGASTIPMQTVKNLFLWSSRSYVRKALEVPLALSADAIWSKKRLMEIYLNVAEWAPNVYGIEAASQHYYGKSAANLTRREAAYLAVTLPNPYLRNPLKPSRGLSRLASIVERRAYQSGAYIKCLYG